MMRMLKEATMQIKAAAILITVLTLITGILYPLLVTGLAQVFFPLQANGSLIEKNGKIIGSRFIGQSFSAPGYFWGRPSATSPFPYNGAVSSGSNSGPSNPNFLASVKARIQHLQKENSAAHQSSMRIPMDLITTSGSGLDPEISPYAAFFQVKRIAHARHLSEKEIESLIKSHIQTRTWGILGEPRVNVLVLNLALDNLRTDNDRRPPKS
jgi:K+-transporting ATPase ATPase C chain